jgi:putative peptidoglycan lipid II flippase
MLDAGESGTTNDEVTPTADTPHTPPPDPISTPPLAGPELAAAPGDFGPPLTSQQEEEGIVRAAAVLAIGNVASRVLGLVREIVKANQFGTTPLLAAFQAAAYVPTSLYDLIIGGMVNSSLVPVFSEYAAKERRDELWQVVSMVLSVATLVLLLVVGLVEVFAPQVAFLVGTLNFQEEALSDLSITLIRMTTPAVFFLGIASVLTAALYALRRFTLPAFVGAAFNGTIVLAALIRPDQITSLVWGLLLGSVFQVVLQLPALRDARLRWTLDLRHPAIRRIIRLYLPILAGLIVNQLAIMLSYNLAIRTGDQSLNYMNYATTLYQFPLGLVVTAISIATLPTLSRQALGDLAVFKQTLGEGVRLVSALILPATAGLFALAPFIIALLFESGRFTTADTAQTALVLRVYLFGMPFAGVDQMLVFASYARKDTWRPALVGFISILVYSITALLLLQPLGLLSLMVADSIKHIVHTGLMVWLLRRQIGGLSGQGIVPSIGRSLVAALATGTVAFLVSHGLQSAGLGAAGGFAGKLLLVLAGGTAGLLTYLAAVVVLNISEARSLPRLLRRRSP